MSDIQDQNCPLCKNQAKFRLRDYGQRKHFLCSACNQFQITIRAEDRLMQSPLYDEWRIEIIQHIENVDPEHIFDISINSLKNENLFNFEKISKASIR